MELILETSSDFGLVAIIHNQEILYQELLPGRSNALAIEVKKTLTYAPFNSIILGAGPGSFTGVRVSQALAQALAFGWKIPLHSTSSLSAYAPDAPNFAIAVDARSGGIYIQENFTTPRLLPREEALTLLRAYPIVTSPHPDKIMPGVMQAHPNPLMLMRTIVLTDSRG